MQASEAREAMKEIINRMLVDAAGGFYIDVDETVDKLLNPPLIRDALGMTEETEEDTVSHEYDLLMRETLELRERAEAAEEKLAQVKQAAQKEATMCAIRAYQQGRSDFAERVLLILKGQV